MVYENFQDLIDSLHSGVSDVIEEEKNIIEINEKRQFIPKDFDTVIAYEGDINSQIITFKSIRYSDNHDLSACQKHEIRWKNLVSGVEGTSKLIIAEEYIKDTSFCAAWEIPPEMCTQAGAIEISIVYYDKNGENIVFSWNTGNYTGLSVGKSMDSVGFQFPAKNEILVINKETKAILAPIGYNNIMCNFGDIGTTKIYFLVDRYLGKDNSLDVFNANVAINIIINGYRRLETENIVKKLYTAEITDRTFDGLVFIEWDVPPEITANEDYGSGKLTISLQFTEYGEDANPIQKRWLTNPYNGLEIGSSLFEIIIEPGEGAITEDYIFDVVNQYFTEQNIVFDANMQ